MAPGIPPATNPTLDCPGMGTKVGGLLNGFTLRDKKNTFKHGWVANVGDDWS